MKPITFIVTILLTAFAAQPVNAQNLPVSQTGLLQNYIDELEGTQQFISIPSTSNPNTIKSWAEVYLLKEAPVGYGFASPVIRQSPEGVYYNFDLTYQNTLVFGRMAKVFVDKRSTIRYVYHNLLPLVPSTGTLPATTEATNLYNNHLQQLQLVDNGILWVNNGSELLPSISLTLKNATDYTVTQQLFTTDGNLLYTHDLYHRAGPDTPAFAYVYDPDPLTTAHVQYGGNYSDNDGTDNSDLQAQLKRRTMPVTLEGDSMILVNERFYLTDISAPTWPKTRVHLGDTFKFSRSEYSFCETNAFFHLNHYTDYVNSLGYNLPGYKIQVDAHAFNGGENSQFNPGDNPPSLQFGDGGIPDAEDAEVVIHEFGHSLSYGAAPSTTVGAQRFAIDEGLGDYFAVSYSKSIDDFNWTKVFNWDGNNGSWRGRTIDYKVKYPNLTGSKWTDGQIWSTSFIRIYNNTDRTTSDKLMLETLYHLAPNMTMPQLAKATLLVDSLKNGGANKHVIQCAFLSTGVFNDSTLIPGCGTFLATQSVAQIPQNNITLYNTIGFAQGTADALVIFNKTGIYKLTLTDINGRTIWQQTAKNENNILINSQNIAAGMYLLNVTDEKGIDQTIKLMRY